MLQDFQTCPTLCSEPHPPTSPHGRPSGQILELEGGKAGLMSAVLTSWKKPWGALESVPNGAQ